MTGRYLTLQDSFDQAFGYLLKAEDLIDDETSSYEKGLIYHELADCTNNFLNGPSSIEYITLAETAYVKANLPSHYLYALSDHAMYLNNIGDYKDAERILNQILDSIDVNKDDILKSWCYDGLMRSKIGQDQFKDALLYYELLSETSDSIDDSTIGLVLVAERKAGSMQRADSIAKYLLKKGNYWALNELNIDDMPKEFISKAYYYQSKYCDDMIRKAYGEAFTVTLRDNLQLNKKLNRELIKNKRLIRTIYLTSFLLMLLVAAGGLCLIYRKWRNQRDLNKSLYNDFTTFINEYNDSISDYVSRQSQSNTLISNLLEKHTLSTNKLINFYNSKSLPNSKESRQIQKFIHETIKSLSDNPATLHDLEEILNIKYNGIVANLKKDISFLTVEEIKIFILSASGFSNIVISHILKETSANYVAVKKTSLRKKIKANLPSVKADIYLRPID